MMFLLVLRLHYFEAMKSIVGPPLNLTSTLVMVDFLLLQ